MKVAPMPFEVAPGKTTTATRWDFAQMGALVPSDIKMAEEVLTTAERDAKALGRPLPKCVLAFSAENLRLGAELVDKVGVLLSGHPTTSLEMSNDWSHATNEALMSLAALLSRNRPERCRIRAPPDEHADADGGKNPGALNKLRLAGGASAAALEAVSEALASAAHSEVDSIVVEPGKNATKSEKGKVRELALGPLRLTSQELTLSRTGIGDIGCVAACGFMRPFAGRLQIARLMECELHDDGALAVARLLRGLSADTTARKGAEGYTVVGAPPSAPAALLKELTLTANFVGDKGAEALAEALPRCDSLERLILDRNLIGEAGAKSLAKRLPRSNVRELVLGSHLGGNPIGAAGAEALAPTVADEFTRAAANRGERLTALALEGCDIGDRGAQAFAASLGESALAAFSLARNGLTDSGAKAMLAVLPETLVSLDLAGNKLSDSAASAAAETLHKSPKLVLSLAQNGIAPSFAALLREEHGSRLRV